jgi:hypothetical protein
MNCAPFTPRNHRLPLEPSSPRPLYSSNDAGPQSLLAFAAKAAGQVRGWRLPRGDGRAAGRRPRRGPEDARVPRRAGQGCGRGGCGRGGGGRRAGIQAGPPGSVGLAVHRQARGRMGGGSASVVHVLNAHGALLDALARHSGRHQAHAAPLRHGALCRAAGRCLAHVTDSHGE